MYDSGSTKNESNSFLFDVVVRQKKDQKKQQQQQQQQQQQPTSSSSQNSNLGSIEVNEPSVKFSQGISPANTAKQLFISNSSTHINKSGSHNGRPHEKPMLDSRKRNQQSHRKITSPTNLIFNVQGFKTALKQSSKTDTIRIADSILSASYSDFPSSAAPASASPSIKKKPRPDKEKEQEDSDEKKTDDEIDKQTIAYELAAEKVKLPKESLLSQEENPSSASSSSSSSSSKRFKGSSSILPATFSPSNSDAPIPPTAPARSESENTASQQMELDARFPAVVSYESIVRESIRIAEKRKLAALIGLSLAQQKMQSIFVLSSLSIPEGDFAPSLENSTLPYGMSFLEQPQLLHQCIHESFSYDGANQDANGNNADSSRRSALFLDQIYSESQLLQATLNQLLADFQYFDDLILELGQELERYAKNNKAVNPTSENSNLDVSLNQVYDAHNNHHYAQSMKAEIDLALQGKIPLGSIKSAAESLETERLKRSKEIDRSSSQVEKENERKRARAFQEALKLDLPKVAKISSQDSSISQKIGGTKDEEEEEEEEGDEYEDEDSLDDNDSENSMDFTDQAHDKLALEMLHFQPAKRRLLIISAIVRIQAWWRGVMLRQAIAKCFKSVWKFRFREACRFFYVWKKMTLVNFLYKLRKRKMYWKKILAYLNLKYVTRIQASGVIARVYEKRLFFLTFHLWRRYAKFTRCSRRARPPPTFFSPKISFWDSWVKSVEFKKAFEEKVLQISLLTRQKSCFKYWKKYVKARLVEKFWLDHLKQERKRKISQECFTNWVMKHRIGTEVKWVRKAKVISPPPPLA